jgi:hypothetical protein
VRWLASRPLWVLAGTFVLVLLGVVLSLRVGPAQFDGMLGGVLSIWIGTAVVVLFVLFFAMLMALFGRRVVSRSRSPR